MEKFIMPEQQHPTAPLTPEQRAKIQKEIEEKQAKEQAEMKKMMEKFGKPKAGTEKEERVGKELRETIENN